MDALDSDSIDGDVDPAVTVGMAARFMLFNAEGVRFELISPIPMKKSSDPISYRDDRLHTKMAYTV